MSFIFHNLITLMTFMAGLPIINLHGSLVTNLCSNTRVPRPTWVRVPTRIREKFQRVRLIFINLKFTYTNISTENAFKCLPSSVGYVSFIFFILGVREQKKVGNRCSTYYTLLIRERRNSVCNISMTSFIIDPRYTIHVVLNYCIKSSGQKWNQVFCHQMLLPFNR